MKRAANLKRTPLKADPAVTAAFVDRGRGKLSRATAPSDFRDDDGHMIAVQPIRDSRARPGELPKQARVPSAARRKALARSSGRCIVCHDRKATTVHHVFPRQKWPGLVKVADNLVGACFDCHMAHEYPGVKRSRIPLAALPDCAVALAVDDGPMMNYLARTYGRETAL